MKILFMFRAGLTHVYALRSAKEYPDLFRFATYIALFNFSPFCDRRRLIFQNVAFAGPCHLRRASGTSVARDSPAILRCDQVPFFSYAYYLLPFGLALSEKQSPELLKTERTKMRYTGFQQLGKLLRRDRLAEIISLSLIAVASLQKC